MGFFRGLFSLLGRAMLCGYFVWLAVRYWLLFDDTVAKWESVGIPEPQYALTGTIVFLGLGCLFVLTGMAAR
ncbi:MAG: DoxX family membrane protein, partial [Planctomycetota bacterium]